MKINSLNIYEQRFLSLLQNQTRRNKFSFDLIQKDFTKSVMNIMNHELTGRARKTCVVFNLISVYYSSERRILQPTLDM